MSSEKFRFTLEAGRSVERAADQFGNRFARVGDDVVSRIQRAVPALPQVSDVQRAAANHALPHRRRLSDEQRAERPVTPDEAYDAGAGGHLGGHVARDYSELHSGGFEGVVKRKLDPFLKALDPNEEERKNDRKDAEGTSPGDSRLRGPDGRFIRPGDLARGGGRGGRNPIGAAAGSSSAIGESTVARLRVDRLYLSPTAARMFARALARHGSRVGGGGMLAGGGSFPGRRSGGTGAPSAAAPAAADGQGKGGFLQRAGSAMGQIGSSIGLPLVGAIAGIAGFAVSAVSSLAQVRQSILQGQDSTLDALGYTSGGGRLVQNAELAQIKLQRARHSNTGADTESSGNRDIRFGLAMGRGGSAGAEMLGTVSRYGNAGRDLSRGQLRDVFGYGEVAGYGGFRQAEFVEQLGSVLREKVESGGAAGDARETASMFADLHRRGVHSSAVGNVYRNMDSGFRSEGTLQNLAVAAHIGQGKSYMQSLVESERGVTRSNLDGVAGLLDLSGMDRETRALIESRVLGVGTATQAMAAGGQGGLIDGLGKNVRPDRAAGNHLLKRMDGVGQDHRERTNTLDETIYKNTEEIAKAHDRLMHTMIDMTGKLAGLMDTLVGQVSGLIDRFR